MKTKTQSRKVRPKPSTKPQATREKRRQKQRHTISLDLSETAYNILSAHASVCGHSSPKEAARYAIAVMSASTMQTLDQDSKEVHDIFETDANVRSATEETDV